MTKGLATSHLASKAAWMPRVSGESNCRLRLEACCSCRNFRTASFSAGGLVATVTRSKSRRRNMRNVSSSGSSAAGQVAHLVDQKLNTVRSEERRGGEEGRIAG